MKKNFKNFEVDRLLQIINNPTSLRSNPNAKLPGAFRQALRININTLMARSKIYDDGKQELIQKWQNEGHATVNEDGSVKVEEDYIAQANGELRELAAVDNELEMEKLAPEILERVMNENEMSMQEDEALRILFEEDA